MMTTMARLPCKQTSPSQQRGVGGGGYSSSAGVGGGAVMSAPTNFAQSRGYWEMQQHQQQQQQPPPPPPQAYARTHHRHHADHIGKRKSAVELLQESKAFYVKSETVLDRKQELKNSGHLQVSQVTAPGAPPRLLRKCSSSGSSSVVVVSPPLQPQQQQPCCWATCPDLPDRPLPPKSPRLVPVPQRRSGVPSPSCNNGMSGGGGTMGGQGGESSQLLQTKLRRLLNCSDSKENVFFPESECVPAPPAEYATNDATDKYRYSPGGSLSPGCRDDERWGQPEVRFKFGRSNSHSHGTARPSSSGGRSAGSGRSSSGHGGSAASSSYEAASTGGVCHKSLPDLHTSTRRRASLSPRASTKSSTNSRRMQQQQQSPGCCPDCETGSDYSDRSFNRDSNCYRSSRHIRRSMGSGGGDASSVLSSGGRTQKSSGSSKLSHGANARDSGGSSGHCTHRSEPPPRIQDCWSHVRRDSGASTQHSTERGDRSRKGSAYNNTNNAVITNTATTNNNSNNNGTPPPAIVRHYSPDSESSNSQTDYSPTCNSRFSDGWKEGRGRPILRSKSDISDRYWRHDSRNPKCSRPPRSMTQLESFFDRLGLEPEDYHAHITEPSSKTSSPIFFDSVSSVDSALGLYPSWAAANSAQNWAANNDDCPTSQRSGDPPSIVERNARIIKWLCQCRKAQFGYS